MTLKYSIYKKVVLLLIIATAISSMPEKYNTNIVEPEKNFELEPYLKDTMTKIHGTCFTIGWLFFILNGVFYLRYYKSFNERKHFNNHKIWFQVHRIFNTLAFIITTVGMIAILIANNFRWTGPKIGGYRNTSPAAVHSMMGVFAYGLLVLQVLNSFLRCDPDHRNRIFFNWIHRMLGVSSFLLATGTISVAAKFFGSHFTSSRNAEIMLFVFYAIIVFCIIANEISTRLHLKKAMITVLVTIFLSSLIVCSYVSALILTSN
uniref:ascorbate ferrireductase (transmembrane) n=1 Tax=Strongyloides venezuelensis TaxID=75913 RepID=A0A0K0G2V1_STRVS